MQSPAETEVTAVDRGHKDDRVRKLGASRVIDYRKDNFTRTGRQYDLIGGSFGRILKVVALGNRLGRKQSRHNCH